EPLVAAERAPGPLDPVREREAGARRERRVEHRKQPLEPRTGLAVETGANLRIADGFKDAASPASLGDGCEVAPGEPAPRRVQHREPRDIVGRVQQRTRQADQVLHGLTLAERLDLDGVDREPALAEPL